jgi:hypothetical protein
MRRIVLTGIAVILCFGFVTPVASLNTSLRCDNLFVEEGVHSAQVQYNCGDPYSKEKSYIDSYGEVEKWIHGPDAGYFYVLYFYVGKLVRLEAVKQ